jgi:hypothetical protein
MSQLLIQNKGEAPVEAFTLLGASLSRSNDGLIGQFGSGAKLAITTLLRLGRKVTVYCGLTRMEFKTKTITINDGIEEQQKRQVYVQFGGTSKKKLDLGWVLDFGAIDWKDVDMAYREFVSNAIDRTIKSGDTVADAHTNCDLIVDIVEDGTQKAQASRPTRSARSTWTTCVTSSSSSRPVTTRTSASSLSWATVARLRSTTTVSSFGR